MAAHADRLALLAIRTGPASQADCQPCASSRLSSVALRAGHGGSIDAEPRFALHGGGATSQKIR